MIGHDCGHRKVKNPSLSPPIPVVTRLTRGPSLTPYISPEPVDSYKCLITLNLRRKTSTRVIIVPETTNYFRVSGVLVLLWFYDFCQ